MGGGHVDLTRGVGKVGHGGRKRLAVGHSGHRFQQKPRALQRQNDLLALDLPRGCVMNGHPQPTQRVCDDVSVRVRVWVSVSE